MKTIKQFPVEGSNHNAKVILLAFIATSLVLQSPALAQTDSLGWKGKELIPRSSFTDSSKWNLGASGGADRPSAVRKEHGVIWISNFSGFIL